MKDKILMVVFVLVLGSILTTVLVLVSAWTAPVITRNEELSAKSSVLQALRIPYGEADLLQAFAENVEEKQLDGRLYYVTRDSDVAFPYSGAGLWGPIEGVIALQPDLETLRGVTISRQEETPGLGSRIGEAEYLGQFANKKVARGLKLVPPGRSRADNEIDAITGATLTSVAFVGILNDNLDKALPSIRKGETP